MNADCTIVISSCDRYCDLMDCFGRLLEKFWTGNKYPIAYVTENIDGFSDRNKYGFQITSFLQGNKAWSIRLRNSLLKIPSKYILIVLDDFFITDYWGGDDLEKYIEIIESEKDAIAMRLDPRSIKPNIKISSEYGEYSKGQAYRVSAQITIWNRQYLIDLLELLGESELWDFERKGSFLSDKLNGRILTTYDCSFPYVEMVCAGRWIVNGVRTISSLGEKIDTKRRKNEPLYFLIYRKIRGFIFDLNPTMITRIKLALDNKNM